MAKLICRGFQPTREPKLTAKFAATNFAISVVGVRGARNPLTKILAHLLSLFAVKEIHVARLLSSPYFVRGLGGVSCFADFTFRLPFSKRIEEFNTAHKTRSFAHAVSFFTHFISETLVRVL
jgi:hypothetical protein